ncbi:hypothetical protein C8R44DRAFT_977669 [Mycena epipterygia]|nr:hypothetical protein C8R44DRAFT_977669 [Mycena epipterygia]
MRTLTASLLLAIATYARAALKIARDSSTPCEPVDLNNKTLIGFSTDLDGLMECTYDTDGFISTGENGCPDSITRVLDAHFRTRTASNTNIAQQSSAASSGLSNSRTRTASSTNIA